jgi:hypothetical protein
MSNAGVISSQTPGTTPAVAQGPLKGPPGIILEVTGFQPIGSGQVNHVMTAPNPPPNVSLDQKQGRVHVRAGGATLPFIIKPAAYRPVGITFQSRNSHAPVWVDAPGSPFRKMRMDGANNALVIDDIFPMSQNPSAKLYKFNVLVQRVSDHAVGIIDPELENEN